jgi:uncharacterized membrane protein YbhN (UPF0104 family)
VARIAAASVALASVTALAVAGVAERASVADSFTVLGHLHWLWFPAALLLEFASMAAFAIMLRRLLAAGGASVGIRPMLATAYAANAVSVSVPLAGPALATAFTFRRFTRQGADAPLVGWSLLAGGVISSAAAVLIVVGGGLAAGNILVTAVTVPGGVLAVAVLVAAVVAMRRPRLRDALERLAGWMLRQGSRMLRRPAADPGRTIRAWAQRLGSLQLPPSGWITATGLALANWLADAAVLAVSIRASGATVGYRRAESQHHARRPRGHRGIAQPGPGRDRAGYRPGPGRRAALPLRQLLAGRTGRVADRVLATASASPPRSRSFAAYRPRTGRHHGR